jgi:serine/threonine protein kinase
MEQSGDPQLSDDDNFDIDTAIGAQLYGISRISRIPRKYALESESNMNSEAPADSLSYRSFSASELIALLQELEIPYLKNDDLMIEARANIVGRGGFGEVKYEGTVTSFYDQDFSRQGAAIKELSLAQTVETSTQERLSRTASLSTITQAYIEICTMKHPYLSSHPNIIQLFGTTDYRNKFIQSSAWSELCLVTEYADLGSLETYLSTHAGRLEWGFKCRLINDIAEGLQAIHSCDIVHNDIKCDNVLLFAPTRSCERIVAKISDFGCSVPLARTLQIRCAAGTRVFSAPEAYLPECLVEPSRDIYSFALLMLQVVMEERPFDDIPVNGLWEFKSNGEVLGYAQNCFRRAAPTRIGGVMSRLIEEALNADPKNRLSDLTQVNQLLPQSYFHYSMASNKQR